MIKQRRVSAVDRRARFPSELDLSPYVRRCLKRIPTISALDVLDLPSGFGRHSLYLADKGNRVVAGDIDQQRLDQCLASWQMRAALSGNLTTIQVDVERSLPFSAQSFDLVLVVDFVSPNILEGVCPLIRPGGYLVYETFSARGRNWQELPAAGTSANRIVGLKLLEISERAARGATGAEVTVKLFAQRPR
ncbi:class I SAM-dependent methyltransferase [Rhizobium sp. NLR12b]|uniref:class I SAM-dependent methyltransferase n=1 Tax=Rhizobium sp. NLR12b TaxID=2731108 RepID=UPI0038F6A84A